MIQDNNRAAKADDSLLQWFHLRTVCNTTTVFLSTHTKTSTLPNWASCSCETGLYKFRNEQFYVKHTSFYRHRSVKLPVPSTVLTRKAASTHACSRFATVDSSQSELLHNKLSNHNNTVPWTLASTTLMWHAVYWQNGKNIRLQGVSKSSSWNIHFYFNGFLIFMSWHFNTTKCVAVERNYSLLLVLIQLHVSVLLTDHQHI